MELGSNVYEEGNQYSEEPEEETENAIRSITEEGFSESKAEEFHRKINKPRVQRDPAGYNDIQANTDYCSSGSLNKQHQYEVKEKTRRDAEAMLAIRSITGEEFEPEVVEQYVQETVIEHDMLGSDHLAGEDSNLEQALIAAAENAAAPGGLSPVSPSSDLGLEESTNQERLGQDDLDSQSINRRRQRQDDLDSQSTKQRRLAQDDLDSQSTNRRRPGEDDLDSPSTNQEGLGQTVADHYNQKKNVGTELRKNSRIVFMRNFNNWTKSMLIDEFLSRCKASQSLCSPIKVLDMGAGKGGDMLKWLNGGVRHVLFADIASVSIEDCKTRYEELKRKEEAKANKRNVFTAEFIAADCSKVRLRSQYEDKALELDLVSCQFCIHYSFESVQQARCMLKNAAECLKPGGFFVGTVPDSNQIIARQRRHAHSSFGNDVYRIECLFDTSRPIPLFGAKYHFNLEGVVNCPEFLVHFGLFERIAAEFGLKLVLKENFKTFYERKIKEHSGLQLVRRMNAFETYPPNEGVDTVGQETDYCHAEAYLSEHPSHQKLGTLSKAEWEAITLYQVFAFEKVKSKPTSKRSAQDSPGSDTSSKNAKSSQD